MIAYKEIDDNNFFDRSHPQIA